MVYFSLIPAYLRINFQNFGKVIKIHLATKNKTIDGVTYSTIRNRQEKKFGEK